MIGEFLSSVVLLIIPEAIPSAVRCGTVSYFLGACLSFLPWASSLGNFDSTIPVYVIRVKCPVDSLLDPARRELD